MCVAPEAAKTESVSLTILSPEFGPIVRGEAPSRAVTINLKTTPILVAVAGKDKSILPVPGGVPATVETL